MSGLPAGVQIVALRRAHHNEPASPGQWWRRTTSCWSSAPTKETLRGSRAVSAKPAPGRLVKDRSDLDYVRVFASRPMRGGPGDRRPRAAGRQGGRSSARSGAATPTSCRGPISCSSSATASACSPIAAILPALRKFFGDSIKGTAEFSYISIGLGMAIGFLIGAIQLPVPGIGKLAIGLSGVLIVALVLGNLRRTGGHELDHPAVGQSRAAQPRTDALPGTGRHVVGPEVRRDGRRERVC